MTDFPDMQLGAPNIDRPDIIAALDIGGSSVKWGWRLLGDRSHLSNVGTSVPIVGGDFQAVDRAVMDALGQAGHAGVVRQIGISTTGSVNTVGVVINVGHFSGYNAIDWKQMLMAGSPELHDVRVVNDGRASAWAEYLTAPAGVVTGGDTHLGTHVHVVVGTGVGGGIIMGGKLLLGDAGHAGYLGHVTVAQSSDIPCSCGKYGHLEAVAAVPAIKYAWNGDRNRAEGLEEITAAVAAGDPHATQVLFEAGRGSGLGLLE